MGYYGDTGGASRFFPCFPADPDVAEYEPFVYAAKASRADRGEGNTHPTVKSQFLLSWLLRLIARPGDLILDPFAGSGSTGVAALRERMRFVGMEQDPEYFRIASDRIRGPILPLFDSIPTVPNASLLPDHHLDPLPGQLSFLNGDAS